MGDLLKVTGLFYGGVGARTDRGLDSQLRALSTSAVTRQLCWPPDFIPHLPSLSKPFLF